MISLSRRIGKTSKANIIKLPNISASVPQLKSAIAEPAKGFDIPDFNDQPVSDEEIETQKDTRRYRKCGQPVLGRPDRRAPDAVKKFAQRNLTGWGNGKKVL